MTHRHVRTFYVTRLPAEADVVEASNGEAAVVTGLSKGLLLPPHEYVGAILEPRTPATEYSTLQT